MSTEVHIGGHLSRGELMAAARKAGGAPCEGGCGDGCGLERVRYFPRQLLGAEDLTDEQSYFREKLRRHNRYLHGWGVVCGCSVRPAPTKEKPFQVLICPGYVITPCGDEVLIGCPALFDVATCMVTSDDPCAYARPCPPVTRTMPIRSKLYLGVCYKECEVRSVRVAPVGCSCDETACDYSRIRDAYEFTCLDSLPSSHQPPPYTCDDLCQGGVFPCPPSPTDNCVVLATITVRGDLHQHVSALAASPAPQISIDELRDRRLLYGTAMLQQMAWCQCGHHDPPPEVPTVDTPVIMPASGFFQLDEAPQVTITDSTPGASIHYTVDESEPTSGSSLYTGPFTQGFVNEQHVTVKAIAVKQGYNDSDVASVTYEPIVIN